MGIGINISKTKEIAHNIRRIARAQEFAPLDIKVTIPGEQASIEAKRQEIRNRYDEIQSAIDSAENVEQIKQIILQLQK
jgi:CRISPR/Cas system CSM-associated protein Csm2 small subunit